MNMPMPELEEKIEYGYRKGSIYLAWGLRSGCSVREVIRDDIKNMFERLKNIRLMKIEAMTKDNAVINEVKEALQSIEDSVRKELTVNALKILEKHGMVGDNEIAKSFLENSDVEIRVTAARLYAKYAQKRNIDILMKIANGEDAEGRIVATKRILQLDGGRKHSRKLFDSDYSDVVREIIFWFMDKEKGLESSDITMLMLSKNDAIRLLATAYAVKLWPRQKQVSLLQKYHSGKTYYYDVVCWLDRVLYAPKALSQGYKKKLLERLN
jgi:hypothetical protein